MAVFNEPKKWAQTLGKDADVVKIPDIAGDTDPSIDKIFPSVFSIPLARGGRAIPRSVLNGLFKLLGDNIFYLQQGGVWLYNAQVDYDVGRIVLHTDGNFYQSLKANGPSSAVKSPDADEGTWTKLINKTSLDDRLASYDTQLLEAKTKCYGNDYYDDSDITSLIYAGNGAGTIRNEVANGNFSRVHPGQTIRGKVTGTTYIVVGCNIYHHIGDPKLTRNHIGLMPLQLIGNDGNLLWSGRTYAGSSVNNTTQGYAPWSSDNNTEGKNQTSCYKDSYIANTVLPKVDNLWLKPDFENQGISILTFKCLSATSFDANATCMSNPNWRGCATGWGWSSRRLVLPSEPEIYGHYQWSGSPYESGAQYTQLPLYKHKDIREFYSGVDIWLKDSTSESLVCRVSGNGLADFSTASLVQRVCPLFLIA